MTRENPIGGLSTTDLLLAAGGVVAVGLVGYLIWKSAQTSGAELPVSLGNDVPAADLLANASVLYSASNILSSGQPLPTSPVPIGGGVPIPSPPTV